MIATRLLVVSCAAVLAGCGDIPYRTQGFAESPHGPCASTYAAYDAESAKNAAEFPPLAGDALCWKRSIEEHDAYDLLFAEFDDQGWVQGSAELDPSKKDYLSDLFAQLTRLYEREVSRPEEHGVSLVVYVHGWHHTADAADEDVHSFRRFLRQIAEMEQKLAENRYQPMRVVGVYIGWRGESVPVPLLRKLTFWERKNSAERVAHGAVGELLMRLDQFRDSRRSARHKDAENKPARNVRMLTIGHSFGGLITFQSLSSEFVRYAVRFKEPRPDGGVEKWMSRIGDLVLVVNPAFEGARYEPLRATAPRLHPLEPRQLPVLIVATTEADWATGVAFPAARWFSTVFEQHSGAERAANVKAVGHNERYTTHRLELGECKKDCASACRRSIAPPREKIRSHVVREAVDVEYELMDRLEKNGIGRTQYLCAGLKLEGTARWQPEHNPFWVVSTSGEIMQDHGDIFSRRFVAFLRQMYLGLVFARFAPVRPGN